jgi:hypothetical protein
MHKKYAKHNTSEHKLHTAFKQFYSLNKIMIKTYGKVGPMLNCTRRPEDVWGVWPRH